MKYMSKYKKKQNDCLPKMSANKKQFVNNKDNEMLEHNYVILIVRIK